MQRFIKAVYSLFPKKELSLQEEQLLILNKIIKGLSRVQKRADGGAWLSSKEIKEKAHSLKSDFGFLKSLSKADHKVDLSTAELLLLNTFHPLTAQNSSELSLRAEVAHNHFEQLKSHLF